VEFPPGLVQPSAESVFFELALLDIVPVIAHPERNLVFSSDPARLESLIEKGAVSQVTAGSLLGDFGRRAQHAGEDFIRRGLACVIASDSHSVERRAPRMQAARERVNKLFGSDAESGLFDTNPAAIIRSEKLPWGI
jgi:protein-tyrosine phosphatase